MVIYSYICIEKAGQLKSKLLITGTRSGRAGPFRRLGIRQQCSSATFVFLPCCNERTEKLRALKKSWHFSF